MCHCCSPNVHYGTEGGTVCIIISLELKPAVRTRNDEVASCRNAAVLNRPLPLKNALPKKPGTSAKKLNYFLTVRCEMQPYAGHARPRLVHI